ncbi:uncharacterized protein ACIBXB_003549 [Morphnus guianensis]
MAIMQASSQECLSPGAPLGSLGSLSSILGSSSSSLCSLYSFPEPWPGAMAELVALTGSGPPQTPKAVKRSMDRLLELPVGSEQERVPGDGGDRVQSTVDAEPPPGSPPAVATDEGELVLQLISTIQAAQAVTEQQCELLQTVLAQRQGTAAGCGGTPPREPPLPSARIEVQVQMGLLGDRVWPQCFGAELPAADADVDKAAGGDTDVGKERGSLMEWERSIPTELGRSSPVELGRSSPVDVKRSSPVELDRSSPMDVKRSSPVELDRSSPVDVKRSSPVELDRSSPVDVKRSSPVDVKRSSPMDVKRSSPVDVKRSSPVDVKRSSPMDVKRSSPADVKRSSPVDVKRSSPMDVKRSSPADVKRSSPVELGRSSPMEPERSSSMGSCSTIPAAAGTSIPAEPSPRQRVPVGRTRGRTAPGPCRAGRCLREGCARLWRCLKAWWRRHWQPCRVRFHKPPCWQRWCQKKNGFCYYRAAGECRAGNARGAPPSEMSKN